MEFKFLKLRDLQGKTPSFPAAGEVHIIYVPEPDNSNLHKAGAGRAMIREILSYYPGRIFILENHFHSCSQRVYLQYCLPALIKGHTI